MLGHAQSCIASILVRCRASTSSSGQLHVLGSQLASTCAQAASSASSSGRAQGLHQQCHAPASHCVGLDGYPSSLTPGLLQQPTCEAMPQLPQLCAVPKRKLTPGRRREKREWYRLERFAEMAECSYCGEVARRGVAFSGLAGNSRCTGQCSPKNDKQYEREYKQPC